MNPNPCQVRTFEVRVISCFDKIWWFINVTYTVCARLTQITMVQSIVTYKYEKLWNLKRNLRYDRCYYTSGVYVTILSYIHLFIHSSIHSFIFFYCLFYSSSFVFGVGCLWTGRPSRRIKVDCRSKGVPGSIQGSCPWLVLWWLPVPLGSCEETRCVQGRKVQYIIMLIYQHCSVI